MIVKTCLKVELSFHGEIHFITGIKITRGLGYKGNVCKIYLPRRLWCVVNSAAYDAEEVRVWGGYNGCMNLLFVGYVSKIRMEGCVVCLECQDDIGMICDDMTTYQGLCRRDVRLSEIVNSYDLKELEIDVLDDVLLGRVRFSGLTRDVLRELISTYGVHLYGRILDGKNHYYMSMTSRPESCMRYTPHVLKCDLLKRRIVRSRNLMLVLSGVDNMNHVNKVVLTEGVAPYRVVRRMLYGHCDASELTKIGRGIVDFETSGLGADGSSCEFGLHGSVTVGGEADFQLYDILEMPEGKFLRSGCYEVTGNTITIDKNGYRQKLTLGKDISKNIEEETDD